MAIKLDLARPLFMGKTAAKENTVQDHIRRAVHALDKGNGVPYPQLEEYMLTNFTPSKSKGYGASFIKSYVRDAVNRYDLLSYEQGGYDYAVEATAARTPKEPRPKRVTKARTEQLAVLKFIRDAGEVADASDVDNTQITASDIAQELGKRRTTIDTKVAELVKEGLLRTEEDGGNELVYLTAAGLAAVNGEDPAGADSAPGAGEAAPTDTDQ